MDQRHKVLVCGSTCPCPPPPPSFTGLGGCICKVVGSWVPGLLLSAVLPVTYPRRLTKSGKCMHIVVVPPSLLIINGRAPLLAVLLRLMFCCLPPFFPQTSQNLEVRQPSWLSFIHSFIRSQDEQCSRSFPRYISPFRYSNITHKTTRKTRIPASTKDRPGCPIALFTLAT